MTQPTDRPRLDDLTSDKLDALYTRLANAEREVERLTDMAIRYSDRSIENGQRAERAEAERNALIDERAKLDRQLTTMTDVARSNRKHVQTIVPDLEAATARAERAEAELAENTGVIQALRRQRDEAEATLTAIRALHAPVQYRNQTICGHCSGYGGGSCDNGPQDHPCPTIAVLDQHGQTPKETT